MLYKKYPNNNQGKIFVFSAASGAGKTTLLNHLKTVYPDLVYSVSATTRKPRTGEVNGIHYFFMTPEMFIKKRDANEFAEWAMVHGHYYGTPKSFIDATIASGRHIIMDIDVFGKKKFDVIYPDTTGILLVPPSLEILEKRLRRRNTDSEDTIMLRLSNARKEMEFARLEGKYEYTVINDGLEKAMAEVAAIVGAIIKPGVQQE
ncbi:MAG TPA: guanylate kinase [Fibrobacteres bacterium]|jgi:guanylate kinase|nr:guanylate kinase [Fibrobacterota bacterium]